MTIIPRNFLAKRMLGGRHFGKLSNKAPSLSFETFDTKQLSVSTRTFQTLNRPNLQINQIYGHRTLS